MHEPDDVNAVVKFLVNHAIRETRDAHPPDGFSEVRKSFRLLLHRILRPPDGTQKIPRKFCADALVVFGCGDKFNIGFTVEDKRFHEINRSASCMDFSAETAPVRSFANS